MTSTNLTSHKLKWLDHIRSDPEMLASDFRVAHALASFMGKSGEMFPAVENVARKSGGASKRTVQWSLRRLVARGHLKVGKQKYRATLYLMGDGPVTLVEGDMHDADGRQRRRGGVTAAAQKGDSPVTQTLSTNSTLSNSLKENTAAPSARDDWPDDFREEFWRAYPLKVARKAVNKKLENVRMYDKVSWTTLMAGVNRIDRHYVPHPVKWLSEGRWSDETTASDLQRRVDPRL
jgi:hypothetical protein